MAQKKLSIVIGTYNRINVLSQCLSSLICKVKAPHEIIVIDAGSTDGTLDYLRSLHSICVVSDQERIGQAQSLNRVFKTLQSKYVCWLSDDNLVVPGMLDQAVSILRANRSIGMVGLKVKDVSDQVVEQPYLGGIWPTGVLNCNQGVLPVQLLIKLGGFDEQFRDYGIDIDLTTRVLLEGYKVVLTKDIAIYHLRDHETESWTDMDGRVQKLDRAQKLYRQKYKALIESEYGGLYDKYERRDSPELQGIYSYYYERRKLERAQKIYRQKLEVIHFWYNERHKLYRQKLGKTHSGDSERRKLERVQKLYRQKLEEIHSWYNERRKKYDATWFELLKKDWRILLVAFGRGRGLIEKDWRNLLMARFVLRWDFLLNSMKPYYLVQRIPRAVREQFQGENR